MSTIKSNNVTASSSNTDLNLEGTGTGTVNLPTGFKVNNTTNNFLSSASGVTVAQGGTGASTFAANGMLFGNGQAAIGATAVGTSAQVLTSNGSGVAPTFQDAGGGLTRAATQATTSGTSWTFGSIPSGTKFIVVTIQKVSFASPNDYGPFIQLGDSGGIDTTGYVSGSIYNRTDNLIGYHGSTVGHQMAYYMYEQKFITGQLFLTLINPSTNTWVSTGTSQAGTTSSLASKFDLVAGYSSLSSELTQLRLYCNGKTGDSGQITITYE
jgi:hypothetical protein